MIVSNRLSDVDTSSCFSLLMYIKENKPKLPYELGVYMYLTVYVHVLFQDRTPRENWIALKHCNWVLDFKTCLRKNTCTRHQTIGIKCRTFNTRERIEQSRFEFTFFFDEFDIVSTSDVFLSYKFDTWHLYLTQVYKVTWLW